MDIKRLERRWESLLQHENAKTEFKQIADLYTEKYRFYHTLEHISYCLELFDKYQDKIQAPLELELAIWLHDVIYDPKMPNNEYLSAEYAEQMLKSLDRKSVEIQTIKHLILCTKHPSVPKSNDEKYLIDIDLAILGADKEVYEHYSKMVKKEYAFLSLSQYSIGRKKVLKSLINSDHIFHTDSFRHKYDSKAKSNIKNELEDLNLLNNNI